MSAEVVERLIKTAKLLLANAEGCAVNHHGRDFDQYGLPKWLDDCQADILAAEAALSDLAAPNSWPAAVTAFSVGLAVGVDVAANHAATVQQPVDTAAPKMES